MNKMFSVVEDEFFGTCFSENDEIVLIVLIVYSKTR